jgi:hypothetical protein
MQIPELNGYTTEIWTGWPTALVPVGDEGGHGLLVYVLLFSRLSSVSVVADPWDAVSVTVICFGSRPGAAFWTTVAILGIVTQ